ncbi:MAG: transporter substrate-binding domain-containing protein [Pseudomonadota bacterium]
MKFAYLIEPPFNDRDPAGVVVGHDVEIARHVCAVLGEPFEPVETEFAQLLPGLVAGRWRMTTGLFATEARRQVAAFTRPVWALPDGLLVRKGNPRQLTGYRTIARDEAALLAVIRDQAQHGTARDFGVPDRRIRLFETYGAAAAAVRDGHADAYASVGRAHSGFLARSPGSDLATVEVPREEAAPAFGAFALSLADAEFRARVNGILHAFLGSAAYRDIAARYGFSGAEVDLVAPH